LTRTCAGARSHVVNDRARYGKMGSDRRNRPIMLTVSFDAKNELQSPQLAVVAS